MERSTGRKQQQLARNITAGTIRGRESLVRRFVDHPGHFPWDWTVGDADEFFAHERSILNLAFATARAYQTRPKVFCEFLTDPAYEWDRICHQGFGRSPALIITEFNRARLALPPEAMRQQRTGTRLSDPLRGPSCRGSSIWPTSRSNGSWHQVARERWLLTQDAPVLKTAYVWGIGLRTISSVPAYSLGQNVFILPAAIVRTSSALPTGAGRRLSPHLPGANASRIFIAVSKTSGATCTTRSGVIS